MIISADPHRDQDEILTEKECAALLKVKRETLSRYRSDAGLPFIELRTKRGNGEEGKRPRIRYRRSAVLAWLDSLAVNSVQQAAPRKRGRPRNVDGGQGR